MHSVIDGYPAYLWCLTKRNFLNRMGKGLILHAAVAAISVECPPPPDAWAARSVQVIRRIRRA